VAVGSGPLAMGDVVAAAVVRIPALSFRGDLGLWAQRQVTVQPDLVVSASGPDLVSVPESRVVV